MFYFFISLPLLAAEKSPFKKYIDKKHADFSEQIISFGDFIDSFFGEESKNDRINRSQIKFSLQISKREGEDLRIEPIARFRLDLPKIQKRLSFIFERDAEGPGKEKTVGAPSTEQQKTSARAFLRAVLKETKNWNIYLDGGIKLTLPGPPIFDPFSRLRIGRSIFFGKWELKPHQDFFWFLHNGFGETTSMDLDRKIGQDHLFRLVNSGTWKDEDDTFRSTHGPSIFQKLSDRRGISYNAHLKGINRPTFLIHSYELFMTYRQKLHHEWLYYTLTPKIEFPKDRNWHSVGSIFFSIETVFGGI